MMPMELKTEKGLKNFSYGFILYMIALAILLVVLIATLGSLSSLIDDPENVDETEVWGALAGLIAGVCLGVFIIIIAFIMFLMGLIGIHGGKKEFGPKHEASTMRGVIFIFSGIAINVFGAAIPGIGSSVVGIVVAILMGMGLLYLIYEIADDKTKNLLWLGVILYAIVSVIMATVMIWLYTSYDFMEPGMDPGPRRWPRSRQTPPWERPQSRWVSVHSV